MSFTTITGCRSCASSELHTVLDYGPMPLSDGLMELAANREHEPRYPLTLVVCASCSLLQILETVDPVILYGDDYPYYSSFSDRWVEHARENVEALIDRYQPTEESLVVELASNDGYLLQWFAKEGIPVLGIDPSPGPAAAAAEKGIPTLCDFFDTRLARRLVQEGNAADLIVGNNVLAHVPDQNDFVAAIASLLAPDGAVVMEFPYAKDLIDRSEFDTIYHEHHCYFSVTAVRELFARHGLELVRVEHHETHGGSLRVFFQRGGEPEPSVEQFLEAELAAGVPELDYYKELSRDADEIRSRLVTLLEDLQAEGARVAGYAAAAKGAILLNYCGVRADQLAYIVDRNVHKHGLSMPGIPIPIVGVETLASDPPDYLLILAWNHQEEIIAQQAEYAAAGGRFIIPIPEPVIL